MKEKLDKLFKECIQELNKIGIDLSEDRVGIIDINISKRNNKRYGVCKQEEPDLKTTYYSKKRKHYKRFKKHHIEISKWVMELNEDIIKNTIIHELIHCLPNCNNHGKMFKKYAEIINNELGYTITRLGNKKEDYEKSNLEYNDESQKYRYKIVCMECNQIYFRQRISKNFFKKYRCGKCRGKLYLINY